MIDSALVNHRVAPSVGEAAGLEALIDQYAGRVYRLGPNIPYGARKYVRALAVADANAPRAEHLKGRLA